MYDSTQRYSVWIRKQCLFQKSVKTRGELRASNIFFFSTHEIALFFSTSYWSAKVEEAKKKKWKTKILRNSFHFPHEKCWMWFQVFFFLRCKFISICISFDVTSRLFFTIVPQFYKFFFFFSDPLKKEEEKKDQINDYRWYLREAALLTAKWVEKMSISQTPIATGKVNATASTKMCTWKFRYVCNWILSLL